MADKDMKWKTLSQKYLIEKPWLTARVDKVELPTGIIGKLIAHPSEYPWHWVVMVIELCFLAGKIVKDARAKKEKK